MALYYSLPVYRGTHALILLLFKLTKAFSREYKYTIGQEIKRDTMQLVRHISQPETTSELSELVMRLTRQIVMHDPIGRCRINGSPKLWNDLPVDKSLFGVNHIPMPNGYLSKNEECGTADGAICPKGLPICNLTSQWLGNFYLNRLDHFVKHTLSIRYYGRYVDDFVIVHPGREYLKELIPTLECFLKEELFLTLHPRKRYLEHYSKRVSFLGVIIRQGALLTGTRTKTGAYGAIRKWGTLSSMRLLTPGEMLQFSDY